MPFRSIVRDVRGSFTVRLLGGLHRGKSHEQEQLKIVQNSCWANLPPELLLNVVRRLEESESTCPERKHVLACAAVCKSWRIVCKEIVKSSEFCRKHTLPASLSLKQPGSRDGIIQCYIKRDKANMTYHLFLCLSPALHDENGRFLLSAKRNRRFPYTEYIISIDADNISRSSSTYAGKLRSNFLGNNFVIYDTQPPRAGIHSSSLSGRTSRYNIGQLTYELNVLRTRRPRGPRMMNCVMHTIPVSALDVDGTASGKPELTPHCLEDSLKSVSFSKSLVCSTGFSSSRISAVSKVGAIDEDESRKSIPLVLKNKAPRWHKQLECWCLNFNGRVTVASVKNFQLIAATEPAASGAGTTPAQSGPAPPNHGKIILQFGKVGKDMFTMNYRYPLSAFQAFAICLTSFDTKMACE